MPLKTRRPKSMKFHAIAVSIICVVVVVMYFIIVPKGGATLDPNAASGDRFVRIVDATWGMNCNTEINRLRGLGHTTTGDGDKKRPLTPVSINNAMFNVTELCGEKMKCSILASNESMGSDPLPACYKELVVGYRCFSIDRKWTKKTDQGTVMNIDCSADVDQAKETKTK